MRERPFAESVLALFAGRERAAAIYGDLAEMAANRGRVWFAAAYLRTLLSLSWRTPLAFISGCTVFFLATMCVGHLARNVPHQEHTLASAPAALARLIPIVSPLLVGMAIPLWFLVPFGMLRYGSRDRFVRIAFVLALLGSAAFLNYAALSLAFTGLVVLVIGCALLSQQWRRPMIVAGTMSAMGLAAMLLAYRALDSIYHPHVVRPYDPNPAGWLAVRLTAVVAMSISALICTSLHRRMLGHTENASHA